MDWPCDPAIPGHASRQSSNPRDSRSPVFTAALFTSSKRASTSTAEETIKTTWGGGGGGGVYIIEYYSAIRKNEMLPFAATWMKLEIIILNEVSQKTNTI